MQYVDAYNCAVKLQKYAKEKYNFFGITVRTDLFDCAYRTSDS